MPTDQNTQDQDIPLNTQENESGQQNQLGVDDINVALQLPSDIPVR